MKLLGLDYGDRRIGVAVSDIFGWTAQGIEVVQRRDDGSHLQRIAELARLHEVGEVVVGLPKNMNGTIGPRGELCIEFAESLRELLGLPVHLWDERLTTVSAERTLLEADVSRKKRKQVVDKIAAGLILQNYLDSTNDSNLVGEEPEIIYIPDEEGQEEGFEVIMKFEVDGSESKYMMVVPLDSDDEEADEVYAFRYEEDNDDLKLYVIEDEAEWQIVEETFNTLVAELDGEE